jgi:hypothetical protein
MPTGHVLVGAERGGHRDVPSRLETAVGLEHDAIAQPVEREHLLRLGQPQLPRAAGVLDRCARRRAGAAVMPADQNRVGPCLGDPRRDDADARLGDELHVDARPRVDLA